MDFLLNEESSFCILPETFTTYHTELLDGTEPTADEIKNAESVLERVKKTN